MTPRYAILHVPLSECSRVFLTCLLSYLSTPDMHILDLALCSSVYPHLFQLWSHASVAGVSVCALACSIGTPPALKMPCFPIAMRNNLPASLAFGGSWFRSSSHAARML